MINVNLTFNMDNTYYHIFFIFSIDDQAERSNERSENSSKY